MIKYFAKCRRRKGFTFTEMIVVVAIVAILMACVAAFAGPVQNIMKGTNAKSDANRIDKIIGDYIEHRLAYANYLTIVVGAPTNQKAIKENTADGTVLDGLYNTAKDAYGALKNFMKDTDDGKTLNTSRILYFHFDDDPTDPGVKHTYKIYDAPVKSGDDVPAKFSELCEAICKDDNLLFTDDFYSGYQYMVSLDNVSMTTSSYNSTKKKAYLNFTVDAYNFEEGTNFLNKDNIEQYYQYIDYKNKRVCDSATDHTTAVTEDPYLGFGYEKLGRENVSFALENMSAPSMVTLTRGRENTTTYMYEYGTDIIVFYNVRTYRIGDDA